MYEVAVRKISMEDMKDRIKGELLKTKKYADEKIESQSDIRTVQELLTNSAYKIPKTEIEIPRRFFYSSLVESLPFLCWTLPYFYFYLTCLFQVTDKGGYEHGCIIDTSDFSVV